MRNVQFRLQSIRDRWMCEVWFWKWDLKETEKYWKLNTRDSSNITGRNYRKKPFAQ
jgi:hypothetical protein